MSAVNDLTSAGESEESRNKLQLVTINQLQGYFGKNNLLQIYESGALYDCTIRAGIDIDLKYKDFKCHKLVLSMASVVFEKMFFGTFKESKMGPAEPILLRNVDPRVFDCAMKNIYGQVKEFQTVSFGVEVYKFADMFQVKLLIQDLDEYFKEVKAPEIFAIFDLYLWLGGNKKMELERCKVVLEREAAVALASEQWLRISIESVLEFLRMDFMELREAHLVRAVIRWGQYQVQRDGDDPTDGQKLRAKILPALKLIRYISLTREQFEQLCMEEFGEVMNADEKNSVFLAIVSMKWKLMPTVMATPRKTPWALFNLEFKECPFNSASKISGPPFTSQLSFQLDQSAKFIGFNVHPEKTNFYNLRYKLFGPDNIIMGKGCDQDEKINFRNEEFFQITSKCCLQENITYVLSITTTNSMIDSSSTFAPASADEVTSITSNGLTLQIHYNCETQMHVNLEKLVFMKMWNRKLEEIFGPVVCQCKT